MFQPNVDITEINNRFYIVGQCWKNRSEIFGERNNGDSLKNYIEHSFKRNALVCRFGEVDSIFENEMRYSLPEYNLNYAYDISKSIFGWLKLDAKNVIILEIKGDVQKFLFVASCALKIAKFFANCSEACDCIINVRYKNTKRKSKILSRYLYYFDNLNISKARSTFEIYRLKQIIIMSYPKYREKIINPYFEIINRNKIKKYTNIKMLVDENYIIGQFTDAFLIGDVIIRLYYNNSIRNMPILEINLNTYFMKESLYRYEKDDIHFLLSNLVTNTKISNDFLVDVIILDAGTDKNPVYNIDTTLECCLTTLSQHMKNESDHFVLRKLINEGYDKLYSKLFLQASYAYNEIIKKFKDSTVEGKDFTTTEDKFKPNLEQKIVFGAEKMTRCKDPKTCMKEKQSMAKPFIRFQYLNGYKYNENHISNLEYIPDLIEIKTPMLKAKKRIKFCKKTPILDSNAINDDNKTIDKNIVVKKPIHWKILADINSTVFEDLHLIKVPLDIDKFEEWFCEPVVKKCIQKDLKRKSIIKDDHRIFLVSIALKTLEKKQIDIYDLDEIICNRAFDLTYEDLQNITRIIPTASEMQAFTLYKSKMQNKAALRDLDPIEQILMINMDSFKLRQIISIYMFERKFIDEHDHIEKLLKKVKTIYDKIMDSNHLRFIYKVLLDVGNLLNYNYSTSKTKRSAKGFKIMSLEAIARYTGVKGDNKLTTYIFVTLKNENPSVFSIFDDLRDLKDIMNESMDPIKTIINTFVKEYNDVLNMIDTIEDKQYINESLKMFLGFANHKLKFFTDLYKEILIVSSLIKRKFGEDEEVSINEILVTLNMFLKKLEEEHKIQSI